MHIADVTMFHAPSSGGVRTYLQAKRRRIAEHPGLRASLVIPGAEHDALDDRYTLPAPRLPLGQGYRFPLRRAPWRERLVGLAPDLIEAGDPYVTPWAALEAGQRLGVPVVGFYHSDLPRLMGDRFGGAVRRRLERYVGDLYGRFDGVLAPCRAMAERLADWGVDDVRVQPLGVDLTTFHPDRADPAWRASLGLPADTRLLVFAGRHSREKNVDVLLRTLRRLGRPYHLLLMGPGMPTRVPDNVTVVSRYCDRREVARALASADAMLHAGTRETFGLVALEAMACGLPVVAARAGALIENVPLGGGLLCTPRDDAAMAEAVEALFDHDVAAGGRHARRHVERRFHWDRVIDDLLAYYATLAPGERAAPRRRHG